MNHHVFGIHCKSFQSKVKAPTIVDLQATSPPSFADQAPKMADLGGRWVVPDIPLFAYIFIR